MLPVLNIGPVAVPLAPLLVLAGFWIGLELAERHAPNFGIHPERFYHLTLVGLVAGVLTARAGYILQAPSAFVYSPLQALSPRPEMLAPLPGWVGALAAVAVYTLWKRIPLWSAADTAVTLFSVLAVAVGLSHLASGDAFGVETNLPWAIHLWGADRHPTQVYEALAALLVAALLWRGGQFSRFAEAPGRAGLRWWAFLALSAASRIVLESFRGDSVLLWNTFRQGQVIAWVVLATSLWQIGRRLKPNVETTQTVADGLLTVEE